MATETTQQEFKAEVQQLLDIVINSLYTDKEIFVRELVSNASDALEKLQHLQLTEREVFDEKLPMEINITTDDTAGTVTIADYGIGMTRDELVENLGTIAHSGSKVFRKALEETDQARSNLIGQFGVGFYSAFMVADEVKVYTHSWRPEAEHLAWDSDGRSGYTIGEAPGQRRGTKVVVRLREDQKGFAKPERIKGVLESYSNFVPFPILLNGERVNKIEALWLKNRKDVSAEDYAEFYKFTAHAFDDPRLHLHFSADAPIAINALLFVPKENPERLGMGQTEPGVALYCRKVLIDHAPKGLLPEWLRFLKGVIDSADLPLNISRESMQDSALVQKLNRVITKKFLRFLDGEAKSDPAAYKDFYKSFSRFLKEGAATDFEHREGIAKLLRFESSMTEKGELTSFEDYIGRMKEGQEEIYYQVAANRAAIENGPYLEAFKARGLEVIFLDEPIDEYVVGSLPEFEGKMLVAADRADVKLDELDEPASGEALEDDALENLCKWMKEELGDSVTEVRAGKRLVESPAVALTPADALSPQMRQMMRAMNPDGEAEAVKVELEINPRHELVKRLAAARDTKPEMAKLVARQVRDNALIAAGLLEDPKDMVAQIYKILEEAVG
ncbi:molecular chaperone HtpG [soil metagenome]